MSQRSRHIPERTCIICSTKSTPAQFYRVAYESGRVRLDHAGRMFGRGAYLCRRMECDETTLKARRLSYALRTPVSDTEARLAIAEVTKNKGLIAPQKRTK